MQGARAPGAASSGAWVAQSARDTCLLPLQAFAAYRHEDRLVISTGSATGAYSAFLGDGRQPTPSFALMDVDGGKVGRQG